jgi:DNA repair protein RadC
MFHLSELSPVAIVPQSTRRPKSTTRATVPRTIVTNVSEASLPYNLQEVDNPEKCYEFWGKIVAKEPDYEADKESLIIVCIDARMKPISWNRVSLGDPSSTPAHPREILRPVVVSSAFGFVLMHNHPSGDPSPSPADAQVTRRIVEASAIFQVRFYDHVIIGRPAPGRAPYHSFREAGLIP